MQDQDGTATISGVVLSMTIIPVVARTLLSLKGFRTRHLFPLGTLDWRKPFGGSLGPLHLGRATSWPRSAIRSVQRLSWPGKCHCICMRSVARKLYVRTILPASA